ncbi:hypothetical protein [Mucilaginibacter sp.]|uniref:hypothetical protein n=1 Tax=Mucilaginibacter sp. TaxID=1882438 RepID=UPI00326707E9
MRKNIIMNKAATLLKKSIAIIAFLAILQVCHAQPLREKTNRLTDSVSEVYHVLTTNKYVKHGLYQALFQHFQPIATGMYENDKKAGIWRFYDPTGKLMQTYDYSTRLASFEAPEDTTSNLRYLLDRELRPGDKVTKPIKTGGRYFGYLNYLRLFNLPEAYQGHPEVELNEVKTTVELLISPGGRLADYKVHINNGAQDNVIKMNTNLPDEEDRVFTPATLNGEPVACRIIIRAYITENGHLDFY